MITQDNPALPLVIVKRVGVWWVRGRRSLLTAHYANFPQQVLITVVQVVFLTHEFQAVAVKATQVRKDGIQTRLIDT